MQRTPSLIALLALVAGCSGDADQSVPREQQRAPKNLVNNQQPANSDEQPATVGEAPAHNGQQASWCAVGEVATPSEFWEGMRDATCPWADACAESAVEQRDFEQRETILSLLCDVAELCLDETDQRDFLPPPVCAQEVTTCFDALAELVTCEMLATETESNVEAQGAYVQVPESCAWLMSWVISMSEQEVEYVDADDFDPNDFDPDDFDPDQFDPSELGLAGAYSF